jgi:membrane AbrB-like protein
MNPMAIERCGCCFQRIVEKAAAIGQQAGHVVEAAQLLLIRFRVEADAIELQFQSTQSLFQFHQALRQGRNGLGQIFGGAGDPERDRFAGHGEEINWADDSTNPPRQPADCSDSRGHAAMSMPLQLLTYLLAGTLGGWLALRTGIPAAPLAGALLGAGIVSLSGRLELAQWPTGTRTALEIAIGTVIGTSLTPTALQELRQLWKPAILITVTLVMTGLVVGLWCSRLLGMDPLVALLGAAPGGISGMSLVGAEFGVGAAVAALHAVRLITVLLVLPLAVRLLIARGFTPPPTG